MAVRRYARKSSAVPVSGLLGWVGLVAGSVSRVERVSANVQSRDGDAPLRGRVPVPPFVVLRSAGVRRRDARAVSARTRLRRPRVDDAGTRRLLRADRARQRAGAGAK